VTYPEYLQALDLAMRERMPASPLRFDDVTGTWTLGRQLVRSGAAQNSAVRFALFHIDGVETLVGSYSGTIGATPSELVQYLVYFLETGTPWHSGLPNRGLA
jgi:hypothetical protein